MSFIFGISFLTSTGSRGFSTAFCLFSSNTRRRTGGGERLLSERGGEQFLSERGGERLLSERAGERLLSDGGGDRVLGDSLILSGDDLLLGESLLLSGGEDFFLGESRN